MNTVIARDPRLKTGAYIREGTTVYEVLGQEKDDDGSITGMYVLENIVGEYSCGKTYVHRQMVRSASKIAESFKLVRPVPSDDVPSHLDAQMDEHIRGITDLAAHMVNTPPDGPPQQSV